MYKILNIIRHDRRNSFEMEVGKLVSRIETLCSNNLFSLYQYLLSLTLSVDKKAIKQELMSLLSSEYCFSTSYLNDRLRLSYLPYYLLRHYTFLIYSLIFSKVINKPPKKYDLIIDGIESNRELLRYKPILKSFNKTIVTTNVSIDLDHTSFSYKRGKQIPIKIILLHFCFDLFSPFLLVLLSMVYRFNIYVLHSRLTNKSFEAHSIYSNVIAPLVFQERHYQTSALKNSIFKNYGGKYFTSYQKNIIQMGNNGMFYDIDILFSLGTSAKERIKFQKGRVGKLIPVGSLFMEHYFPQKETNPRTPKFDIILIGYNIGEFQDSYKSYWSDYYEHFNWLKRYSEENPNLKIGIKHHPNYRYDPKENEITKTTKIKLLPHDFSSYEYCLASRVCLTFGSTLAFEVGLKGKPVFFLDPQKRNSQYLPSDPSLDVIRLTSYNSFKKALDDFFSNQFNYSSSVKWENFILSDKNVSKAITRELKSLL